MFTAKTDELTREYFNSIMVTPRYLDSDIPSLKTEIFGESFDTPVMTAALSHLHNICDDGMCEFAKGALKANALHFVGMGEDDELQRIIGTGAKTVKIIKPHANEDVIYEKMERAVAAGAIAVGMDIDHAISHRGEYDNVFGLAMEPKTTKQLEKYINESGAVNRMMLNPSLPDSSASAMAAYCLSYMYRLTGKEEYRETAEKIFSFLKTATRRNGVIDYSQGDTMGVGYYASRFSVVPAAQGFTAAALNLLY